MADIISAIVTLQSLNLTHTPPQFLAHPPSTLREGFIESMADFISAIVTLPSPDLSKMVKMAVAISTGVCCSSGSRAIACHATLNPR